MEATGTAAHLYVESGGAKRGCVPRAGRCEVLVSAKILPNPFKAIRQGEIGDTLENITSWIIDSNSRKWQAILTLCRFHLNRGSSLRVECAGGQHRSYAIVEALALEYRSRGQAIVVVHQDKK